MSFVLEFQRNSNDVLCVMLGASQTWTFGGLKFKWCIVLTIDEYIFLVFNNLIFI